jgi:hypothetical protein
MHSQIEFLKRAVAKGSNAAGILSCYVVKDDQITAYNGNLQAGAPYPSLLGGNFNVPAKELEAILDRAKGVDVEITHVGSKVIVKCRRIKVDISCFIDEPPPINLPDAGWRPLPPNFRSALRLAAPFVIDKLNFGIRILGDRVTVLTGRVGIDVEVPGLAAKEQAISLESVEFITAQDDDPTEYQQEFHQNGDSIAVSFRWPDGRWLHAAVLSTKLPASTDRILASGGDVYPVEVTNEWREAWADAAALSEDTVELLPAGMMTTRGTATMKVDIEVATPLPDGHNSCWSVASLDPVIAIATHWNPAAWPKPAAFKGVGFRGVVMGAMARGAA